MIGPVSMKIQLTLNSKQSRILIDALDAYARLHVGHVHTTMCAIMRFHTHRKFDIEGVKNAARTLGNCFANVGEHTVYSLSDPEVPDEARSAWDIKDVVKDVLFDLRGYGGNSTMGSEPRPKCEKL
jgi:hypothetical protein